MQTLTPQEEGACVGTEMSGGQPLPSCRTSHLNAPCLTSRRSQPPLIFRATSAIFVADRPERIIRPEIAQNAAEANVARPGGIVVCLINTGDRKSTRLNSSH